MYFLKLSAFGIVPSAAFLLAASLFASLTSALDFPVPFSWPLGFYLSASYPLHSLLLSFPAYDRFQWTVSPEGGPAAAFVFLLAEAFITWAVVIMSVRHACVSLRRNVA